MIKITQDYEQTKYRSYAIIKQRFFKHLSCIFIAISFINKYRLREGLLRKQNILTLSLTAKKQQSIYSIIIQLVLTEISAHAK